MLVNLLLFRFAHVYFNSERRAVSSLVVLEATSSVTLTAEQTALLTLCRSTPALAVQAKLAFIKLPPASVDESLSFGGESFSSSAGYLLHELAWNKDLVAVVLAVQRSFDRHDRDGNRNGDKAKTEKLSAVVNAPNFIVHVALYLPSAILVSTPSFPSLGEEVPESNGATAAAVSTEKLTLANINLTDSVSINEKIAQNGFVMLSREYTKLITGANLGYSGTGRSDVRGRPGMQGNFLLTSASSPTNLAASFSATNAAVYGRLHAALQRTYSSHVGIYRYGDPGDSDDDERREQASAAGATSGAGAVQGKASAKKSK